LYWHEPSGENGHEVRLCNRGEIVDASITKEASFVKGKSITQSDCPGILSEVQIVFQEAHG
jgi:hypothetical protein